MNGRCFDEDDEDEDEENSASSDDSDELISTTLSLLDFLSILFSHYYYLYILYNKLVYKKNFFDITQKLHAKNNVKTYAKKFSILYLFLINESLKFLCILYQDKF